MRSRTVRPAIHEHPMAHLLLLSQFLAHRRQLVSYADTIVRDHGLAEDIVQEAYLRLDRRTGGAAVRTAEVREPVSYLYLIVRNLAIDTLRRAGREQTSVGFGQGPFDSPADQPSPEAEVMSRHEVRQLDAALQALPERARTALILHRVHGMKLADIAARLGVSVGTAHALVVDALEHCKSKLAR